MADRGRDPESLEREIERTRAELALTIDALADRLNPRHAAQRGVTRLKEEAGQVAAAVSSIIAPAEGDKDDEERHGPDPRVVLAGVGVAVTVTAVVLWRRGRRRRRRSR